VKKILAIVGTLIALQIIRYLFCFNSICTTNSKMVFGLLGHNWLAIVVALLVLLLIILFAHDHISSYFLIGAVLCNISERVVFGGVKDYFSLPFWPDFNIADIVIVSSLLYFIFSKIISERKQETS